VPFVGGLVTVVLIVAMDPGRVLEALVAGATNPVAWVVLAGVLLVVVALLNLLLGRLVDWGASLRGGEPDEQNVDANFIMGAVMAIVAVGVVAVFGLSDWIESGRGVDSGPSSAESTTSTAPPPISDAATPFVNGWELELDGSPLDLAFSELLQAVYITVDDGRILRVDLEKDGNLRATAPVVATDGLSFPRGVAIMGDRLFVGELIGLPCDPPFPACSGRIVVGAETRLAGAERILEEARGRITEYLIDEDGSLSHVGILVDGLPVADTQHAVNDLMAVGSDSVLVSIGNIEQLMVGAWEAYEPDLEHANKNLLGTVIQVNADTGDFEVVARGLRNVYGITSDPLGVVWGTDNDGPAIGFVARREEVLRIRRDADFGYPYDGSAPPFEKRTDSAAYTLDSDLSGAGGIEWVNDVDGDQGLLLGFFGQMLFLELEEVGGVFKVTGPQSPKTATRASGFVVGIEGVSKNAAVYVVHGPDVVKLLSWDTHP
jgi:hypothetical protein